jgi:hypothetical protein
MTGQVCPNTPLAGNILNLLIHGIMNRSIRSRPTLQSGSTGNTPPGPRLMTTSSWPDGWPEFRYYDMDDAVGNAHQTARKLLQ